MVVWKKSRYATRPLFIGQCHFLYHIVCINAYIELDHNKENKALYVLYYKRKGTPV